MKSDFTKGPIFKRIILYTLPILFTGVLQLLFNATDLVVAGRLSGEASIAAVGSCSALINLIVALFLGLSVGAGVIVAQSIGAGDMAVVKRIVHTAWLVALLVGVVVALVGILAARPLLLWMNTDPAVLEEAVPYLRAYFLGAPALMVYNFAASMVRSAGDTKHPMIFLVISGAMNVLLNIVITLMLGEGYGALSVGIATAIASVISAVEITVFLCRMQGPLHLDFKKLMIDRRLLGTMVRIGIPAGIQSSLFSFSNVLIQSTVNGYGQATVAGNTAAASIEGFIYIVMNAFSITATTFVGQNFGAMKHDRVRKIIFQCSGAAALVGMGTGALALLFSKPLLAFYSVTEGAALSAGLTRMSIICTTYWLCGMMEVACGCIRGMGDSVVPMIVSLLGSCALRVVWIYTVCPMDPTNIRILYLSYPVSWLLTSSVHYFIAFRKSNKYRRMALQGAD